MQWEYTTDIAPRVFFPQNNVTATLPDLNENRAVPALL
jgi:hypothetical protein